MTNDELCEIFRKFLLYNPSTGILVWKAKRYKCRVGDIVGTKKANGYRNVSFERKFYQTHRVIWMMQTGAWPSYHIDHINGERTDNRWGNLRDVPHAINLQNQVRPAKRSSTGVLGVVARGFKFVATMSHNKRQIYVGTFDTKEAAHAAYVEMKRKVHAGCTL